MYQGFQKSRKEIFLNVDPIPPAITSAFNMYFMMASWDQGKGVLCNCQGSESEAKIFLFKWQVFYHCHNVQMN